MRAILCSSSFFIFCGVTARANYSGIYFLRGVAKYRYATTLQVFDLLVESCEGRKPVAETRSALCCTNGTARANYNRIFFLRGVAQFGRALGSGPRGRWFKSSHSDQKKALATASAFFNDLFRCAKQVTSLCGTAAIHHFCLLRQIHHLRQRRKHHYEKGDAFASPFSSLPVKDRIDHFPKHYPTGKMEPPMNSRMRELRGTSSDESPRKYSRNLRSLFASGYSGASWGMAKRSGSA